MNATTILAGVLIVAFAAAGAAKLAAVPAMRARAAHVGFSVAAYRRIGILEILGVLGLLAGALVPMIGALAAGGTAAAARGRSDRPPPQRRQSARAAAGARPGPDDPRLPYPRVRRPPMSRTQGATHRSHPGDHRGGRPGRAHRRHPARAVRRRLPRPRPLGGGLPPAACGAPGRRDLPHRRPTGHRRAVRRRLASHPRPAADRPEPPSLRRARPRRRRGKARAPEGEHVRPAGARAPAADQPQGPEHCLPTRKRGGHRRRPGRPGTGAGRLHRPAHRPARVPPGQLRARLRRSQQHCPRGHRLDHAGPHVRAALARHRHRHHCRSRPVGGCPPGL